MGWATHDLGAQTGRLTLSKVNGMRGAVQIGCGVTTKSIRGRPYLYFWHYEERAGRRVQAFRYLGAARSETARQKLAEALDAYLERVTAEVRRKRAEVLARAVPP